MGRTVSELEEAYPDVRWRQRFRAIADLVEILADCTIGDDYSISDALHQSIVLTAKGVAVQDRLIRKDDVPVKEAHLMCALTLGYGELFIDVEETDPARVAEAVDAELKRGRIRFPFVFGRELYDAYAEQFRDERDSLSPSETRRLLDVTPPGVFQYGNFVVGPFGVTRVAVSRALGAPRHVRLFHCSEVVCRALHPVLLETSSVAAINQHRSKIQDYLRTLEEEPSDWWQFVSSVGGDRRAYFGDQKVAVIAPLAGDALNDDELRLVVAESLKRGGDDAQSLMQRVCGTRNPSEAVLDLSRAEMMQLLLAVADDVVAAQLDRLVRAGDIQIPEGEVRRPVSTAGMASGAFRMRTELSSLGVRFVSDQPGFANLRLRRLLDKLYVRDLDTDVEELDWQLRGVAVDDIDERLEEFFQVSSPREVLRRLVLARKTNLIAACAEVNLDDPYGLDDDELIDTLLWKFGFEVSRVRDFHGEFWAQHDRLWSLVQSSSIGGSSRFLEAAGPYFAGLEGLLLDAGAFAAWALLVDHIEDPSGFFYDNMGDRLAGLALMDELTKGYPGAARYSDERVDLGGLVGAFSTLANRLEECDAERGRYQRAAESFPDYAGMTDLKAFEFSSIVPFNNLTAPSRSRILEGLRSVSQLLIDADVPAVRNDYAHYRRTAPEIKRLEFALENIRQAVTRLETLGLCRMYFVPGKVSRDGWGRSVHVHYGARGYEHRFTRPSRFDWMGLPPTSAPTYLMPAAVIGGANEVLRFEPRFRSPFAELWRDYPKPRQKQRGTKVDEVVDPVGGDPRVQQASNE